MTDCNEKNPSPK